MGKKILNAFVTVLVLLALALVVYFIWQQGVFTTPTPFEAPGR